MSFIRYLKDKRYFFCFYLLLMSFVSLIMIVSVSSQHAVNNVLYANVGGLIFAAAYLVIGYYYHQPFNRQLLEIIENQNEGSTANVAMPEPRRFEQELFLELVRRLNGEHIAQLHKLALERRDHQDFIMSWIHEVKLPIASSRLIMDNSSGKSVDYLVDKLEDELGKIDHYVEQALYYSRIDSFSKDYFITEIQLNAIVKQSIKKYAKLFINKRIRFTMSEEAQFVYSDGKWLAFVLDQIVANALKYTDEGGEVSVRFDEDGKERRLLVRDTGIGIKLEDLRRVFDKGFTGSNGRSLTKSTGMGLYLAQQMAVKLGHRLSIASEEGEFTQVTIHFPKIRGHYYG